MILADVTFNYELMIEADDERDMMIQARKGSWDWQYMSEANDLKYPIGVNNIEIVEVTDEN